MTAPITTAENLCFVGDLCPSCTYSKEVKLLERNLEELRKAIPEFSTLFFNLECSLFKGSAGGRDTEANEIALRALEALKPAVANLSNNHHFDNGIESSLEIRRILDEIGIPYVGVYKKSGPTYNIVEINNRKMAVICRTARGTNPKSWGASDSCIIPYDFQEVLKTCELLDNKVDMRIVCLHWGAEYYQRYSPRQQLLVEELIQKKIDVIWGHHAHTLQKRIYCQNTLALYNLGNCIFGQSYNGRWPSCSRPSMLVGVEIREDFRKCWEVGFTASNSGNSHVCQKTTILSEVKRLGRAWYSGQIVIWFCVRLYKELFVFGTHYLLRKLKRKSQASSIKEGPNEGSGPSPQVSHVIRERVRRVFSIWEDE